MTSRQRLAAVALVLGAALSAAPAARADDTKVVAAEALFNEGRALLDRGRFEEACERFERSEQIDPAVGTLLNLGECYEKLDRIASAWAAYRQAVALAVTRNDERRATLARRAAANVEPRLARLSIAVDEKVPGLVVTRNGTPVDAAAFDTPVPVDAGPQVVIATAPARKPWQTTIEVAQGSSELLRVPPLVIDPSADAAPSSEAPAERQPNSTQRTVAIALEIGGGAVLAGGLLFGGLAAARWSSVEESCPDGRCPTEAERQRRASDADAAQTFATLSNVSLAVGGAALVAGIVLHLTAPNRRLTIAPAFDRRSVGFVASLGL